MFFIEPYETATDDEIFRAWHKVDWQGEIWQLGLKQVRHDQCLVFRRSNGPLLHGVLIATAYSKIEMKEVTPGEMWPWFVKCQQEGRWSRHLHWTEQFKLRNKGEKAFYETMYSPNGAGNWSVCGAYPPHYAGFHWFKDHSDFLSRASTLELLESLESAPDCEFARRYLSASSEMYWPNVWTWRRGDYTEFERVLTWALMAQEELWHELGELHLQVDLTRNWNDNEEQLGAILFSDKHGVHSAENPTPWPPKVHQALATALEWFGPQVNQANVDKHLCLQQTLNWGCVFIIEPKDFTAHEQIEASVKWHEWLSHAQKEKELDAEKSGA